MKALANSLDQTLYLRADKSDAPEILALQKIAYQSEAELYGDDSLPPLQQTLADLLADFERTPERVAVLAHAPAAEDTHPDADQIVFLKAVVNGKIIGSVRGFAIGATAYIRRVIVHPYFRGRGIGRRLLREIENAFPDVQRFEAKTGHQSKRNLFQLTHTGYQVLRTEPFTPHINWVFLQKERAPAPATTKNVK
ncbi:MAG TPA: GNAT family N-acetyltransferase [Candidatus Paceibacterota bacterium]|nr:GNAT family N-acetyltransferase [Verrucomicrobiota bacterium]HSA10325.1 GNAT family N-acetyltransferase [Candidatus Paceibacterota bacterium]